MAAAWMLLLRLERTRKELCELQIEWSDLEHHYHLQEVDVEALQREELTHAKQLEVAAEQAEQEPVGNVSLFFLRECVTFFFFRVPRKGAKLLHPARQAKDERVRRKDQEKG